MPAKVPDVRFRTCAELAEWCQVSPSTIQKWRETGCGVGNRQWSARIVVQWLAKQRRPGGIPKTPATDDPMMVDGDSPALERYRHARAGLAELELAKQRRDLVARADWFRVTAEFFGLIRDAGQQMQRRGCTECADLLIESIDQATEQLVDKYGDDLNGNDKA